MDIFKKTALTGLALLVLGGCKETRNEWSGDLYEDAVVVDVVYNPSKHGSGVGPTIDLTGEGGVGVAFTSVSIPEKYAVVFRCQHGKFIVEGTDQEHKFLWEKSTEGDSVKVKYRELYQSVYDDPEGDGNNQLISRTLVDYDFLDASKK